MALQPHPFHDLHVSSLEYTIDFFCHTRESVNNLILSFEAVCVFPYTESTWMEGGKFLGWDESRIENAVYHVNMGANHAKIYERGNDDNGFEDRKGWPHKNVDRIRLEFTFGRNFLASNQITDISYLVEDAKFFKLCPPRIQFKNFTFQAPSPKTGKTIKQQRKM